MDYRWSGLHEARLYMLREARGNQYEPQKKKEKTIKQRRKKKHWKSGRQNEQSEEVIFAL